MLRKIIRFLDKHRIILVLIILIIVSILFLGVKSYLFLHHDFKAFTCTKELNEENCYHDEEVILKNAEESKNKFFKNNSTQINDLKKEYKLPKFNMYTAYYYEVASLIKMIEDSEYEKIYTFFNSYCNTFNLKNFYQKNNIFFEIFYQYKLP